MTKNVLLLLLYPGTRPQKVFRSRKFLWTWLQNIYSDVHEIIPDEGFNNGYRILTRIKSYGMLTNRISDQRKRYVLHLETVLKNTGQKNTVTIKLMPLV
jgi:hypothetical protein